MTPPVEITADHAYFRLRDEGYADDDLSRWAETIRFNTERGSDVFVYFKYEAKGKGPEFVRRLSELLGA